MSTKSRNLIAALAFLGALASVTLAQDASYQTKVYVKQGGDELVVASGGAITVESGGAISGLDSGELGFLNGVTAGVCTASKAAVVDANKDFGDFRNLDAVNIDAGASGTAGSVDVFPATALKGKLAITKANNTNDDATTLTVDAHGQATTVHIPDGGAAASYVAQSTAALTLAEVDVLDGVTPSVPAANKALVLGDSVDIAGPLTFSDAPIFEVAPHTSSGVGTGGGAGVTVTELGDGIVHKTYFSIAALSISVTDSAGVNGGQGSQKIYDFPAGAIQVLGASYNLSTLAGAGGIADGAALIGALGTTAAAADNSTLTTTEADFIASTTGTLVGGAGDLKKYGSLVAAAFDGTTTAVDLYLNLAVPDADISASDTVEINSTIEVYWVNLGDF